MSFKILPNFMDDNYEPLTLTAVAQRELNLTHDTRWQSNYIIN